MNYLNQKYYDKKYKFYTISDKRSSRIIELTGLIKGKEILDVGCGVGKLGKKFKDFGNEVFGVDISANAIRKSRKLLDGAFVVDLLSDKLPFSNHKFDLVICSEVIEHLTDSINLLKEVRRVMKRNGVLILTTPNIVYWGHRITFLRGKFEYQEEGPFDEGHVHFYNYDTLKEQLCHSGYEIIKHNNVYLGPSFLNFIKNKFPNIFAYQLVFCAKLK